MSENIVKVNMEKRKDRRSEIESELNNFPFSNINYDVCIISCLLFTSTIPFFLWLTQ